MNDYPSYFGHGLGDLADLQRKMQEIEDMMLEHWRLTFARENDPVVDPVLESEYVLDDVLDAEFIG